jgi:hypothetical protein
MGTGRFMVFLGMAGLLLLAGCAETFTGGGRSSPVLSGALMETKSPEGKITRLSVTELASWQHWHRNPVKGSGDNLIIKAEITF